MPDLNRNDHAYHRDRPIADQPPADQQQPAQPPAPPAHLANQRPQDPRLQDERPIVPPVRGGLYAARHFHFLEDDDAYAPVDSDDDVIDLPHRHRIPNPRNSHLQQGELNLQGLELTALPHAYACPEATFYRFCRNNRHILHKVLILTVRRTGTPVYFFIIRD